MTISRKLLAFTMTGLLFLATSCGSKVTQDNFDKIKSGMTMEEVEKVLGKPTKTDSAGIGGLSGGASTWEDGSKSITVSFMNGKSVLPVKKGF